MAGRTKKKSKYHGEHHDISMGCMAFANVRTYSMDLTNDPRFFQDNIINYRLAAFGQLGVVSTLLVGVAQTEIFDMNKNMGLFQKGMTLDRDGIFQLLSFVLLSMVFFLNMLATYIGFAQPYHTYRLMTSGPMGFETAASYYLNKNIVAFRHLAVKGMLMSLPVFMLQCGLRTVVKFSRGTANSVHMGEEPPLHARIEAWLFGSIFVLFALFMWYIDYVHFSVFREQYRIMVTHTMPAMFSNHMANIMTPRATASNPRDFDFLDV